MVLNEDKENEQCVGGCVKRPAKQKERARAAIWPDLPVNVHMVIYLPILLLEFI